MSGVLKLNVTVVLLLFCLFANFVKPQVSESDLENLIEGRCADYANRYRVYGLNCEDIWDRFRAIITDKQVKTICPMDQKLFDSLVDYMFSLTPAIQHPYLWSKTGPLVAPMCDVLDDCTVLETTFPGYVFNNLDWCNANVTGGVQYDTSCGCTGKAEMVYAFWKSASLKYSQLIVGDVGIFLNGSLPSPFMKTSTLATTEIPNLKFPTVTRVKAFLLYSPVANATRTTCAEASMTELRDLITSKSIPYECHEDSDSARHYLCAKYPTVESCKFKNYASRLLRDFVITILLTSASMLIGGS